MYNNPNYNMNAQYRIDSIDNQIKELENMRAQIQRTMQPTINQTFQLAPNNVGVRYVTGIDDVYKELVLTDSLFVNKEFTNMWLKTVKGEIRSYKLTEIVKKDDKDVEIEKLKKQIEEMKGNEKNEQSKNTDVVAENKND